MTKEQLIKEFREKFVVEANVDDVFINVANEDELKELEAFLLSAFDAGEKNGIVIGRASGIEEVKEHFQLRKDVLLNGGNALPFERSGNPQTMTEARAEGLRNAYNEILRFTPSSSKDN